MGAHPAYSAEYPFPIGTICLSDGLRRATRDSKVDWFDPDLNPKIQSFCVHYGTVILPTKPRMPRHKGKVEAGVKYVQATALNPIEVLVGGNHAETCVVDDEDARPLAINDHFTRILHSASWRLTERAGR